MLIASYTTLGFSQYSYVEAVPTQRTIDFISALNRCSHYFKGIPKGIVPYNLKSAVVKTDRYEPEFNKLLEDWANHYNTSIISARSRKPQDKSLAENLVKQTYSRIYAPLRNRILLLLKISMMPSGNNWPFTMRKSLNDMIIVV